MLDRVGAHVVRRAVWVIVASIAAVIGLNAMVPQLETVIERDSTAFVPHDAESEIAFREMSEEFGTEGTATVVFVVAERAGGLTGADWRHLRSVAAELRDEPGITSVQDVGSATLRRAITSSDGEAAYVQVGFAGETGSPAAARQLDATRDAVHADVPSGLELAVTGPGATIADMQNQLNADVARITVVTVGVIALILLLIYRSLTTAALILGFIGLSLAASRSVTAFFGQHLFPVSTFTASLLIPVILGAATNYAIFLLSRYHEFRREGVDPGDAAARATGRIGSVVLGSGLTVMIGSAVMIFAELGFFRTTGPAIAVSIATTLVLSLTLFPAVLAVAGRRGLFQPRPQRSSSLWAWLSGAVVARPGRTLLAGLVPLLLLAAFYPVMDRSFDERVPQAETNEGNLGYELASEHFPENELLADYVLIQADRDLRNPRDLAALEAAARAVAQVDGVESVRTVTRPLGEPIAEASVGHQAGIVGDRLGDAAQEVEAGRDGTGQLVAGAEELASGADQLATGAEEAADGSRQLASGTDELRAGLRALVNGAARAEIGAGQLEAGADELATGLHSGHTEAQRAVDGLERVYDALRQSPICGLDPYCRRARDGVRQIWEAERDQLVPGLLSAAQGADALSDGADDLEGGLAELHAGLAEAGSGADQLSSGQDELGAGLRQLADGAEELATGGDQVAAGTREVDAAFAELTGGLDEAADYLNTTAEATEDPILGGFYLPPQAFQDERFAMARSAFLSADGRSARMVVVGGTDAFGAEARERSREIAAVAESALRGTRLEDSSAAVAGFAAANADIEELSAFDFLVIAIIAITLIFLVLIALLRAIASPIVLLATVLISYLAAVGLGVLVWQVWLDVPFHWSVPVIAFVILVAVGADYNMLLAKRMHEDAPDGNRAGLARAVASTGSVITSAGIVFAASNFALMTASVSTLQETGFVIGTGLLLDAFIVRSTVVPALASMLGRHFWWPQRGASPT